MAQEYFIPCLHLAYFIVLAIFVHRILAHFLLALMPLTAILQRILAHAPHVKRLLIPMVKFIALTWTFVEFRVWVFDFTPKNIDDP
jgi:hypothetical protein